MDRKRVPLFMNDLSNRARHVIPLVLAAATIVAVVAVNPVTSSLPEAHADTYFDPHDLDAGQPTVPPKRICRPEPPDYPGCTKAQVRADAEANTKSWLLNNQFGTTNNVLNTTNLTQNQKDKVWTATRDNLKEILAEDASRAVRQGRTASKASWTTEWRNNAYTLASFPYAAWTNQMFEGCDTETVNGICPGNLKACFDSVGNTTNGWAYLECSGSQVPNSWDGYWQTYYQWINDPGAQGDTVCQRELFKQTFIGTGVGLLGAVFAGPGALLLAVGGGIVAGLLECAADALSDQWNLN